MIKSNILVNLIPIRKGGGQQVATNFVNHTQVNESLNFIFLVTQSTEIHKRLVELDNKNFITIESGYINRLKFNSIQLKKIIQENNIDIIYTLFGPSLRGYGVKTVTGCAYSNLFFPEINFWSGYSKTQRLKLKVIDFFRLKFTLRSDAIIFENAAMQIRAVDLFNYPRNKTTLILPSISDYDFQLPSKDLSDRLDKIDPSCFNILFLTGWHKNKNLQIIPRFLKELKKIGRENVNCVISVSDTHPESKKLLLHARQEGVEHRIIFVNSIYPNEVPHLYNRIDAVGLLSLLESFSNNIIESWFFEKILFITDAEWSRAICEDAAVYVDRDNALDIANKINAFLNDDFIRNKIQKNSKKILTKYPNPKEKVNLQLTFLQSIIDETND